MPNQTLSPAVQNHFIAGLKTEFTGLNFPENAATDTQNCVYSLIGDVTRRLGIDYEEGFAPTPMLNFAGVARSSFRWLNAGGDGLSQILVAQVGYKLYFWYTSSSTVQFGPSAQYLNFPVDIRQFQAQGNTDIVQQIECQFASGNGYLFVFHPSCDPFYCTFIPPSATNAPGLLTNVINLQIRDVVGIPENTPDNFRPGTLSNEHLYNLLNQGWTQGSGWTGTATIPNGTNLPLSNVNPNPTLNLQLTSQSATNVLVPGDEISVVVATCAGTGSNPHNNGTVTLTATVTSYNGAGGSIGSTVTANSNPALNATGSWSGGNFTSSASAATITLVNQGFISKWQSVFNNFPSNADVWWLYKDTTDAFNPATTGPNVQPSTTAAPKGTYLFNPFIQDRSAASGIGGLTPLITSKRPSTGAFYQGRVFYAGVNSSQAAGGDEPYYTWTENIYFSQIIENTASFSKCYQTNDPTTQTLFEILPSDGGVIQIQGCGAIYKLFPLRFGILVFAANGIWFLSGSTGIGFTADDFSVTKISSIQSISGTSYVDVQGYPFFWNNEGIYQVTPSQQPGSAHSPDIQLDVSNITLGSILTYYADIPLISKPFARGDYDSINYIIQWVYRSTPDNGLIDRYSYDTILNYNVITKAFYPYTIPVGTTTISGGQFAITAPIISDVKYINFPGSSNDSPDPVFKYITQLPAPYNAAITLSQEIDPNFRDFFSNDLVGQQYTSYFVTGFTPAGSGYLRKTQVPYLYLFLRNTPIPNGCTVQSIWDYASDPTSGRWSGPQKVFGKSARYGMVYRKIRFRGRGLVFQMKVSSIPGLPFDIMGWSALDATNQGI